MCVSNEREREREAYRARTALKEPLRRRVARTVCKALNVCVGGGGQIAEVAGQVAGFVCIAAH